MFQYPPNAKNRFCRIRLADGTFIHLKARLDTPTFYRKIVFLKPVDTYISIGRWLNPATIKSRRHPYCANVFLGSDYVLDFDEKKPGAINKSINCLRALGWNEFALCETSRGYQLWVLDFDAKTNTKLGEVNPRQREARYLKEMRNLTRKLRNAGIEWDHHVSNDTRRVLRMWNSTHHDGTLCCLHEQFDGKIFPDDRVLYKNERGFETGNRKADPLPDFVQANPRDYPLLKTPASN